MAGRERGGGGQLSSLIPLVTSFSELPAQHLSYFVASFVTIPLRTEDKRVVTVGQKLQKMLR